MTIPTRLMGTGQSAAAAAAIAGGVVNSISAAGTTNAGATALSGDINVVTTAAASSGVRLMVPEVGSQVVVANRGANPVNVYPGTGAKINALTTTSGGFAVPAGGCALFIGTSSLQWFSILSA